MGIAVVGMTPIQPCARPHSTDPLDWIIQHVCADASDKPIPADPYDGCPANTHERRLNIGDPLPYFRHDPPGKNGNHPLGYLRHDAYPLIDLHFGGIISANDHDFDYTNPYGAFNPGDGDGYDVYRVWNGYVTGGSTRDATGYSQTTFGLDCKPFGGWVFFPVSFLTALRPDYEGGEVRHLHGDYWEQRGEAWPGRCDASSHFTQHSTARWSFEPARRFGGVNGEKVKIMDAIVATHGLPDRPQAHAHFHLERFYFTDMYGMTRFEAWWPKGTKEPNPKCADNAEMTYHGIDFVATSCRDHSATEILDPPQARFPWPYPQLNLLSNWHFDQGSLMPWRLEGPSGAASAPSATPRVSDTKLDTRFARGDGGVKYLQIDCLAGCGSNAGIYQDIPIDRLGSAKKLDYGFSGVADGPGQGVVKVSLFVRDREGHALWSDSFDATVDNNYRGISPADSVYRASSVFLHTSEDIPSLQGAETLRLSLSPETPVRIDLLDAWVMPR